MFEMDKQKFGMFLSSQRKEKGLTQKELASQLFISDKAVSKWERGISMPDISLLMPLADILEVSVTELLEGRKIEKTTEMDTVQVEDLVKKALAFSGDTPEKERRRRKRNAAFYGGSLVVVMLELTVCGLLGYRFFLPGEQINFFLMEFLSLIFSGYFWLFARERLPVYYDENKISVYSDGFFSINMVGLHFNNSNWPHILSVGRIWSLCSLVAFPLAFLAMNQGMPQQWAKSGEYMLLVLFLAGLFLPMYVVGKKYE